MGSPEKFCLMCKERHRPCACERAPVRVTPSPYSIEQTAPASSAAIIIDGPRDNAARSRAIDAMLDRQAPVMAALAESERMDRIAADVITRHAATLERLACIERERALFVAMHRLARNLRDAAGCALASSLMFHAVEQEHGWGSIRGWWPNLDGITAPGWSR